MLTPLYVTRTLAAGARVPVYQYGRHILVALISASTVELTIGDDAPQQIMPGLHIDCEDRGYSRLLLRNSGGVASTVVLVLSQTPVTLENTGAILLGVEARLISIDQEISGGAATAQIANLLLPASPAAGLQIFAANAARTEVEISAPETNGGFVYLGITAARCSAVDKFIVLYPGGVWWSEREKGAIFGSGNDALEVVNGRQS